MAKILAFFVDIYIYIYFTVGTFSLRSLDIACVGTKLVYLVLDVSTSSLSLFFRWKDISLRTINLHLSDPYRDLKEPSQTGTSFYFRPGQSQSKSIFLRQPIRGKLNAQPLLRGALKSTAS